VQKGDLGYLQIARNVLGSGASVGEVRDYAAQLQGANSGLSTLSLRVGRDINLPTDTQITDADVRMMQRDAATVDSRREAAANAKNDAFTKAHYDAYPSQDPAYAEFLRNHPEFSTPPLATSSQPTVVSDSTQGKSWYQPVINEFKTVYDYFAAPPKPGAVMTSVSATGGTSFVNLGFVLNLALDSNGDATVGLGVHDAAGYFPSVWHGNIGGSLTHVENEDAKGATQGLAYLHTLGLSVNTDTRLGELDIAAGAVTGSTVNPQTMHSENRISGVYVSGGGSFFNYDPNPLPVTIDTEHGLEKTWGPDGKVHIPGGAALYYLYDKLGGRQYLQTPAKVVDDVKSWWNGSTPTANSHEKK
jgi:hypothetical protein